MATVMKNHYSSDLNERELQREKKKEEAQQKLCKTGDEQKVHCIKSNIAHS